MTSQSKDQDKSNLKSSGNNEVFQNPSITTAVIVRDLKEYVEKVDAIVRDLDRREPQVLIEARIVDVVSAAGKKTGFDWQMLDHYGVEAGLGPFEWKATDTRNTVNTRNNRSYQYDNRFNVDELNQRYDINGMQYEETTTTYEEQPPGSGNWVANTLVTPTRTMTDSIRRGQEMSVERADILNDTLSESRSAAAVLSMDKMRLFLSALESDNNAEMVSHPVIVVGNKVEAKIHIGENSWRISLRRNVVNTGAAPEANYSEDASPVDLGLRMWVIPEVDLDHSMVRLTVNPAMTIWLRDIKTEQGSVYPVTSTRQLTSRVNVPSTHTVVIGGLMENRKTKTERKVPLLGDIPLLGYLFKYNEDLEQKHNLIIMITPTILDETAPATGLEELALATIARMGRAAETNSAPEAAAPAADAAP
jgi:general secretion pathway protein D